MIIFRLKGLAIIKENSIQLLYQINDSTCVGLGPINGAKYLLHGNKENKYIGEYPEQSATQVNPYWIHQGILHINREQKNVPLP